MDWRDIDLSKFRGRPGLGRRRLAANFWRLFGLPLLRHLPTGVTGGLILSAARVAILRRFGARIGHGVHIQPCTVLLPWNLEIGNHVFIGEGADLYALAPIVIGSHVCISQRAKLCTGSHDVSDPHFGLITGEIHLKDGSWVCADCFVGPGVTLCEGAVAAAGSVVVKDLPPMTVWGGNPCRFIKVRAIQGSPGEQRRLAG
jgi:putative colanic acid biosynthesis acetyltransferase WcaF